MKPPKAMILAAGRGKRMQPLTDTTPKPLLEVHGKPLIEWHLEALAASGVREVIVNTAWLEGQIVERLADATRFGLDRIDFSMEGRDHGGALETAGGIAKVLPRLGERFWLVSADIHMPGFRFDAAAVQRFGAGDRLAHLWLVPNPPFHPKGDFGLAADGTLLDGTGADGARWTYANVALCRPGLVAGVVPGTHAALAPLLFRHAREGRIGAEVYGGVWENVGTPEQLEVLNRAG